jgi:hypothetical protein
VYSFSSLTFSYTLDAYTPIKVWSAIAIVGIIATIKAIITWTSIELVIIQATIKAVIITVTKKPVITCQAK